MIDGAPCGVVELVSTLLRLAQYQGVPLRERAEAMVLSANSGSLDRKGEAMTEDGNNALDVLDGYRQEAGLSHGELWLRYFELGGMSTGFDLEAFLYGVVEPSDHDHDVIAQALNERFTELGGDHPVPYAAA